MIKIFKNILSKFGVDWAIFYTSSGNIIRSAGGLLTVVLIASFLTKEEQGFYYTFSSVLAIQIFFELGLGGIISQFVAHEMAHLSVTNFTEIEGNPANLSRLGSLIHFCVKWYAILSVLLLITLLIAGISFFDRFGGSNPDIHWKIPWAIIAITSSLNLLISPWRAVLQGMNKVKEMARIALVQQTVVMVVTWLGLIAGAKLYVLAINSVTSFLVLIILYARTPYPRLIYRLYRQKIVERVSYLNEIFPYQWKIALSWISGYFIFQLFNPLIFAFNGAAAAGQMGITLVVLNAILSLVVSWTTTKIPVWSTFIARKEYSSLDRSLKDVIKNSSAVSTIGILGFLVVLAAMGYFNIPLADRFLPVWICAILLFTIPLNNIVNAWATYLRCHKQEPFLAVSIVTGLFSAGTTWLTAKYIGVEGVAIGYFCVILLVSFPFSYYTFRKHKKLYHA